MIKIAPLVIALVLFSASTQKPSCRYHPAEKEDHPHGANETIQISGGTVKHIQGKVSYPNDEPVKDAVVEIYDYQKSDTSFGPYSIARTKKRRAACLTDENGHFCFTGLPSGRYFLRAGTRESQGMQEIDVTVKLDRSSRKSEKEISIRLEVGT